MSQFGGGRLGGVPLVAGGTVAQLFRNMTSGSVSRLLVTIFCSLRNAANATFTFVTSTGSSAAAEGVDDLDILMNALITRLTLYWEEGQLAANLTLPQWRTILAFFNLHDVLGTLRNGATIPASGSAVAAHQIILAVPASLERYFFDGNIFAQGSMRLSSGMIEFTSAASLTPAVVLANATCNVTAVSESITVETGPGGPSDLGQTWKVNRQVGLPNIYTLSNPNVMRLGVLDVLSVAANPCDTVSVGPFERLTPTAFGSKYIGERLPIGGTDITARCTPYIYLEKDRKFSEFGASFGGKGLTIDGASGASTLGIYDIMAEPPKAESVRRVSFAVGAGGAVSTTHPPPRSLPPGASVPAELAHLLPVRIVPGAQDDGGTGIVSKKSGPDDAAAGTVAKQMRGAQVAGLARVLRGGIVK